DRWTKSIVSFEDEEPCIGRAAIKKFEKNPDCIFFDWKVICNETYTNLNSIYNTASIKFSIKDEQEPFFYLNTSEEIKSFSTTDINKIFLEKMRDKAIDYQKQEGKKMKAVVTIPQYFQSMEEVFAIKSIVQSAKTADIEIIDIIEESHADLLYYLSNERYAE